LKNKRDSILSLLVSPLKLRDTVMVSHVNEIIRIATTSSKLGGNYSKALKRRPYRWDNGERQEENWNRLQHRGPETHGSEAVDA
jgi:hypothetical protein